MKLKNQTPDLTNRPLASFCSPLKKKDAEMLELVLNK